MREFLRGLQVAVPGSARVMGALAAFEAVVSVEGEEEALARFWKEISQPVDPQQPDGPVFADVVLARNAELAFAPPRRKPLEIIDDLDVRAWWPTLSAESQDAIWGHLEGLVGLAQAIHTLDPAIVEVAVGMAEEIADKLRIPEGPTPQAAGAAMSREQIMGEVQRHLGGLSFLSGMGGGMGGGGKF